MVLVGVVGFSLYLNPRTSEGEVKWWVNCKLEQKVLKPKAKSREES